MAAASLKSRFRHYNNLGKTHGRLERLLRRFRFVPITPFPDAVPAP